MNQQQAENALNYCRQAEAINFEEAIIKRLYPDRQDLDTLMISQMYLHEFFSYSKRVFTQFIAELQERECYLILPNTYIHPTYGSHQLENQLSVYINHVTNGDIGSAEQTLLWLIGYQLDYGFFYKNTKRTTEITAANLNKLSERLQTERANLDKQVTDIKKIYDDLSKTNSDIQAFTVQKKEELNTITTNLATSTTQTNQINDLLTRSSESNAKLNALLEQQEANKRQFDTTIAATQTVYDKTNLDLTENIKTVTAQIDQFKKQIEIHQDHLQFVEGKRQFFEERINYLNDLIGREVGASLFETFKQRKSELQKPVLFWRWAVPVMSIATIVWIFFLFSNQPHDGGTSVWWEAFAVNTLKSIPAIFLLLFAINQYRKERNFQEEYAFKSAVALTIDAYAGRLQDVANKDKLIMEAVLNVYKTPIEEKQSAARIKNKTLLETFKTITETSRDLIKGVK